MNKEQVEARMQAATKKKKKRGALCKNVSLAPSLSGEPSVQFLSILRVSTWTGMVVCTLGTAPATRTACVGIGVRSQTGDYQHMWVREINNTRGCGRSTTHVSVGALRERVREGCALVANPTRYPKLAAGRGSSRVHAANWPNAGKNAGALSVTVAS
jgi:hypothetical protein